MTKDHLGNRAHQPPSRDLAIPTQPSAPRSTSPHEPVSVALPRADRGSEGNRVYPIRYAYSWIDTTTGTQRTVMAISHDDAYESCRDPPDPATLQPSPRRGRRVRPRRWLTGDIAPAQPRGSRPISALIAATVLTLTDLQRSRSSAVIRGVAPSVPSAASDIAQPDRLAVGGGTRVRMVSCPR